MLEIWKLLRAGFFERLPAQDRLKFNRMHVLARRIAKDPAHSNMRKQELVYPLLHSAVEMCRKTLK
jgi:hypothetical protein